MFQVTIGIFTVVILEVWSIFGNGANIWTQNKGWKITVIQYILYMFNWFSTWIIWKLKTMENWSVNFPYKTCFHIIVQSSINLSICLTFQILSDIYLFMTTNTSDIFQVTQKSKFDVSVIIRNFSVMLLKNYTIFNCYMRNCMYLHWMFLNDFQVMIREKAEMYIERTKAAMTYM